MFDNIPVLSFIIARGKCRYCKSKISFQYPFIELVTGVIFGLLYLRIGLSIKLIYDLVFASILLCVVVIDYKHEIIPDSLNLIIGVVGLVMVVTTPDLSMKNAIYGFLIGGGALFLIALAGPMGGGDIKYMAATGVWLGLFPTVLTLMISFIIGGVISVLLILLRVKDRKDHIPFGPFLVIGTIACYWYYNDVLLLYLNLLN